MTDWLSELAITMDRFGPRAVCAGLTRLNMAEVELMHGQVADEDIIAALEVQRGYSLEQIRRQEAAMESVDAE